MTFALSSFSHLPAGIGNTLFVCLCMFLRVCGRVGGCVWLTWTLMSQLITVESLGLSLALRGSNTRSSQQHGGEMQATSTYLFFHWKSRKFKGRNEHLSLRCSDAWWKLDSDQKATEGFIPHHLCMSTNPDSCYWIPSQKSLVAPSVFSQTTGSNTPQEEHSLINSLEICQRQLWLFWPCL